MNTTAETPPLVKSEFEALAAFRYQLRRFLLFSELLTRRHGVTNLQYLLLLQVKGFPGREWANIGELAERLQAKGLHLQMEIGQLPSDLWGDPTRLQQALLNYVTNAVKFTEAGCIALRTAVVPADVSGILVRFEVSDSGIGPTEAQQAGLSLSPLHLLRCRP